MNELDYYNRQKEGWDDKEIQDIRIEYETKEMTVSDMADIHRRTPGSIAHKVKNMGLITHFTLSRGYADYKNSKLYKEIIVNNINGKKQAKQTKESKVNTKLHNSPLIKQDNEIIIIRTEIAELKKDVKEMLRLMNALYDFESQ